MADVQLRASPPMQRNVTCAQVHFGRGQIIRRHKDGVLWGGSDSRADGHAIGW